MSVTYTTIDGELLHENRGGVETYYLADPQGSLIECHDANGNTVYETWYWPYGEIQAETGTNPSPWAFVGTLGYYSKLGPTYVRARYYQPELTRWLTVDPLWPDEPAYGYVMMNPSSESDYWGLRQAKSKRTPPTGPVGCQHTQAEVEKCLGSIPNGYNCNPKSGDRPQPGHPIDIPTALCVFYYEDGMCDSGGGPSDNGGGMGQLTNGAITGLGNACCNKGVTSKSGATGANWCSGAQASYIWMRCRGLHYPGDYGDSTYGPPHNGEQKIRACAKCIRSGGAIWQCGHQHIGVRP